MFIATKQEKLMEEGTLLHQMPLATSHQHPTKEVLQHILLSMLALLSISSQEKLIERKKIWNQCLSFDNVDKTSILL